MSQEKEFIDAAERKLSTARLLFRNKEYGDAVSRAYYSMYNASRALLFLEDSKPKTHEGTASELGKLYREELGAEMTRQFSKIQNKRLEADYEPSKSFTEKEAEEVLETAENFLEEAKRIVE